MAERQGWQSRAPAVSNGLCGIHRFPILFHPQPAPPLSCKSLLKFQIHSLSAAAAVAEIRNTPYRSLRTSQPSKIRSLVPEVICCGRGWSHQLEVLSGQSIARGPHAATSSHYNCAMSSSHPRPEGNSRCRSSITRIYETNLWLHYVLLSCTIVYVWYTIYILYFTGTGPCQYASALVSEATL